MTFQFMAKSWLAFHFQCVKSSNEHSFEQQGERIEQRVFWGEGGGGRPFMTYFFAQFERLNESSQAY